MAYAKKCGLRISSFLLYSKSLLCIWAPGLSYLERLSVGLPTILVGQNNEHVDLINSWVDLGCALKANNNITSIEKNIKTIIQNKNIRKKIIINGTNIVDGQGSRRIARNIQELAYNNV